MKQITLLTLLCFCLLSKAQDNSISEQIKIERDSTLNSLQSKLHKNQVKLDSLTQQLSSLSRKHYGKKIELQEKIQKELDKRNNPIKGLAAAEHIQSSFCCRRLPEPLE